MIHTYDFDLDFGIEEIVRGDIIHPLESYLIENHDNGVFLEHYATEEDSSFIPARSVDSTTLQSMIVA